MVASAPWGMHLYELQWDGRLVLVGANPAADRILGIDHRPLIGKTIEEAFPPLALTEVPARYREVATLGEEWSTEEITYEEGRIKGAFEVHAFQTAPAEMAATFVDVSDRKRAVEALRQQRDLVNRIMETSPVGITASSREGRITFANSRAEAVLGIGKDEVAGRRYDSSEWRITDFDGNSIPDDELPFTRVKTTGQPVFAAHHAIGRPDGQRVFLSINAAPLFSHDGQFDGMVAAVEDVTERKQWEVDRERLLHEAQEANQAKDQFLAVLSHELRNPLAAIRASVEVLRRSGGGRADPPLMRAIEVIERNEKLQARLVNDLLDLSRLSKGMTNLNRTPVELEPVVRSTADAFQDEAARAGVTLDARTVQALWVNGDEDRLRQIVMNLLSNALKFTLPGGKVTVTLERVDGNGRVTVTDTGIGIEASRLSGLFAMFQQGQIGGQRARGLGVGLALVASFTGLHGGRVWAESDGPGRGSRFCVELPLTEPPAFGAALTPSRTANTPLRVLVLEDNPDTRAMLAEALALCSYQVLSADSGEAALALLAHESVDVILADIGLPGMDGYQFMRQARLLPGLATVPALAVTGYGQDGDVRRAHEAGFTGHFVKPVDIDVLDRHLRKTLHGQASRT